MTDGHAVAIEGGEFSSVNYAEGALNYERPTNDLGAITDALADRILSKIVRQKIIVLIPAYNEELTIGSVVLNALKYADQVFVVNDGSRDKTSEIARAAGAEVIDHIKNSGKAAALKTGFTELHKRDGDIIVMMDGDGQHCAAEINRLVTPIINQEADLVIGSRFLNTGNTIPYYRQIGQRVLNRLTNMSSSKKVSDTQSGFRAFNRKALQQMNFNSNGFAVEQNMIIHCSEKGLRIAEVPISVRYDVPNGHKQGSFSMGIGLLNNIIATIGYKRPLLLFGVPGLILSVAGLFIGLLSIFEYYYIGSWLLQSLIAGFMIILGAMLAVSALSLNSLALLMHMNDRS